MSPRSTTGEQMALDLSASPLAIAVATSKESAPPSDRVTAPAQRPHRIVGPRPPRDWEPAGSIPRAEMNQLNNRRWIRFLLIHKVWLTPLEKDVCLTVMRQSFPSAKQRRILWWALYRIYPVGCGKWGSPSSN